MPDLTAALAYATLSRAFLYPTGALVQEMLGGGFTELVHRLSAGLPQPVRSDMRSLRRLLPGSDLEAEYQALFNGDPGVACPLHETEYTGSHVWMQTQQMADIAGFYRAFGVDVQETGERPDFLATELEFMYLLALKETIAVEGGDAEGAEISREARRKFLREHVAVWLPMLAERLRRRGAEGFYPALVRVTEQIVTAGIFEGGPVGAGPGAYAEPVGVPDPARCAGPVSSTGAAGAPGTEAKV